MDLVASVLEESAELQVHGSIDQLSKQECNYHLSLSLSLCSFCLPAKAEEWLFMADSSTDDRRKRCEAPGSIGNGVVGERWLNPPRYRSPTAYTNTQTERERKKKTVWKAKVARIGNDNNLNSTLQPTQTRTLVYVCVFILL